MLLLLLLAVWLGGGARGVYQGPFSAREKTLLLKHINQMRASPQMTSREFGFRPNLPRAANMKKMRWDERLEQTAQQHSDLCNNSYTPNPETHRPFLDFYRQMPRDVADDFMGELITAMKYDWTNGDLSLDEMGRSEISDADVRAIAEHWFTSEMNPVFSFANCSACGPTQQWAYYWHDLVTMLYADSTLIGCAQSYCPNVHRVNHYLVTCHVYPGPYFNRCPYKEATGEGLLQCGEGYVKEPTTHLCTCKDKCKFPNKGFSIRSEFQESVKSGAPSIDRMLQPILLQLSSLLASLLLTV